MSVYDTSQPLQRGQFLTRAKKLADRGCIVDMSERRPQRSTQQNKYLHTILAYFGCQIGETMEYVKTNYYKMECNGEMFAVDGYDRLLGRKVRRLRSSASLSTEEMTLSIERFRNWASGKAGVYIPSPDDQRAMAEMEREIGRNKEYI